MMVAVAVAYSPPPQHSPMLGHLASSHTWTERHATILHVPFCAAGETLLLAYALRDASIPSLKTEPLVTSLNRTMGKGNVASHLHTFALTVSNTHLSLNFTHWILLFFSLQNLNSTNIKVWTELWGRESLHPSCAPCKGWNCRPPPKKIN